MPIKISEIEEDEMLRAFEITSICFRGKEPVWEAMFPQHETEAGMKSAARRWILQKRTNPQAIFAKAVDEETGGIIGTCFWHLYHPSLPAPPANTVEGEDPEFAEGDRDRPWAEAALAEYGRWIDETKEKTEGELMFLEALAVDPAWQRKGAGTALVGYGCQIADRLGVASAVASTKAGLRSYEKNGYVVTHRDVVLHVPEQFREWPKQHFSWMRRPKTLA